MSETTWKRIALGAAVSVGAFALCGAAGLWGVALAAPALVFAPSAVKQAVAERKTKRALDAELSRIFDGHPG
jgi:hypothetical protein